ncbi:MAG: carbohydrate kinase family protein [Blastocatellia bacterium]
MSAAAKHWDVISAGDVFIDLVMTGFAGFPAPGEEAQATAMHRDIGGGAAITACGLARLGLRTALVAVVGAADSSWFRERLATCGVETSALELAETEQTALTVSVSTPRDRMFFTYPGANRLLAEMYAHQDFAARLARARHAHMACAPDPDLLVRIVRALRAAGTTLSLDVGWHETWLRDPRARAVLREVDFFMPNEHEAAAMTGQTDPETMLRALAAMGLGNVILKLGANGSAWLRDGAYMHAAPVVVSPVDTTGAGDCFDAGFLYAFLHAAAPLSCLRAGNYCGAQSTLAAGGLAGFPSPGALRSFMANLAA